MDVRIRPYDPAWPARYHEARAQLAPLLEPWRDGEIEHVGSTAVQGLAAKPIIDMVAPVRSHSAARAAIPLLEKKGWLHWADDPYASWRHWLLRPSIEARTHHLYLMEPDEPELAALITWRDHLRAQPEVASAYEALKRDLAARHAHDRTAYTNGKTAFINKSFARMGKVLPHPREYGSRS